MTPIRPLPFEVAIASGLVLRGLEFEQDGPPVVLVHDIGGDADSWRGLPLRLSTMGFRAMSLELRGHGLSDGEPDPNTTLADLAEALSIIGDSFGPVGFVGLGGVATVALALGPADGSPVHILISPRPNDSIDLDRTVPAMRALFAGARDEESDGFIRSVYQEIPGQNMWFSSGIEAQGVDLLDANPTMVEQIAMFLRRYLTAHHLAWIADHRTGQEEDGPSSSGGQSRQAASE